MPTAEVSTPGEPVPFFTDGRSVREKLNAERRDWIPSKPGSPELVAGLVLERGSYTGLNDRVSPTLVVLDADGLEWGVIAFHGFLRQAVERQTPRIGDWVAIAFLGTKPSTKTGESDAYIYKLVVERNPSLPLEPTGPESDAPDTAVEEAGDDIPF